MEITLAVGHVYSIFLWALKDKILGGESSEFWMLRSAVLGAQNNKE